MTRGVRATAEELRVRMDEFGGHAVHAVPPDSEWAALEPIEVEGSQPRAWLVDIDLWNVDGRRSDLTLSMEVVEDGDALSARVNDLRTL
jgi:hypothetical protein